MTRSEPVPDTKHNFIWWLNHIENRKLYVAIKKLSLLKLRILDLVAINGYTCEEAGDILGISRSMVSTHLMEIRSLIRPILSDKR